MKRRKFLSWLGTAAALPAFAPLAKLLPESSEPEWRDLSKIPIQEANPGGWVSYRFRYTVLPPPAYKGITLRNCPIRNIPADGIMAPA
jgi:hypothetical protein